VISCAATIHAIGNKTGTAAKTKKITIRKELIRCYEGYTSNYVTIFSIFTLILMKNYF